MPRTRVIPCLLLDGRGLVKTIRFREKTYIGDPRNAVKIFNEREVDELVLLDIAASRENRGPDLALVRQIVSEAFMPLAYGGGVRTLTEARALLETGVEKIVVNTAAFQSPGTIATLAKALGSQSVVGSMDVVTLPSGRQEVWTQGGRTPTGLEPEVAACRLEEEGAGELIVNSVDRDGTMSGFDLSLVRRVASCVRVPVVACGGAGKLNDLAAAATAGASAVAAGSLFVFKGRLRGVLINYPEQTALDALLAQTS